MTGDGCCCDCCCCCRLRVACIKLYNFMYTTPTPTTTHSCGNFGCVGSASGRLDRYNMQSGLHRGGYSRNSSSTTTTMNNNMQHHMTVAAHDGAVTGVATDSTNTVVVTVGHDGWLRVWDFKRHGLLGQVNVGAPCVCLDLHPTSLLAGVACAPSGGSDGSGCGAPAVRVYDVSSRQLVRRFVLATRNTTKRSGGGGGSSSQHGVHNNNNNSNSTVTNNTQIRGVHVRDVCISADGRWLLAGSSEGLVCVWDIAAGHMLQVCLCAGCCVCVCLLLFVCTLPKTYTLYPHTLYPHPLYTPPPPLPPLPTPSTPPLSRYWTCAHPCHPSHSPPPSISSRPPMTNNGASVYGVIKCCLGQQTRLCLVPHPYKCASRVCLLAMWWWKKGGEKGGKTEGKNKVGERERGRYKWVACLWYHHRHYMRVGVHKQQ